MTAEMQVGLDYAFVAPAADTSLKGETLMVDDTDKSVRLTGPGWAASTTPFGVEGNQANFPFLGTTHGSLNPGDEVEFTFHGEFHLRRSVNFYSSRFMKRLFRCRIRVPTVPAHRRFLCRVQRR